jgi:hypothetical protein
MIRDIEFADRNAASVPLTSEETREAEIMTKAAQKDQAAFAMGMSAFIKDMVAKQGAAPVLPAVPGPSAVPAA